MFSTLPCISDLLTGDISKTTMETAISQGATSPLAFLSTNWDRGIPQLNDMATKAEFSPQPDCCVNPRPVPTPPQPEPQPHIPPILPKPDPRPESPPIIPKLSPSVETKAQSCDHDCFKDVKVKLQNQELWQKFYDVGNEMMVTRSGRLIFPVIRFKLTGLSPNDQYNIGINFPFVDEYRYRFSPINTSWKRLFSDNFAPSDDYRRYYEHGSSPARGEEWCSIPVTFPKVKLTSSLENIKPDNIYLRTMRKYRVQLVVTKLRCVHCQDSHTHHIDVPLTDFIAVTAYNNYKVTQLKIENNPYAKYLRDDNEKKSTTSPKKSEQNVKKATQTTRTNRKRKRENVTTSPSAKKSGSPDPKIECYWSKCIEPSPCNTLESCSEPSLSNTLEPRSDVSPTNTLPPNTPDSCSGDSGFMIDLTSSRFSFSHKENNVLPYYPNPYGNELELSYSLSNKLPSYQSNTMTPIYCSNNYEPYITLNCDSYYNCDFGTYPLFHLGTEQYTLFN